MKFIHFTDTHLTANGTLFGIDVDQRLRDAVSVINARDGDAELAVITGDIAHWAEPEAYTRALDALNGLKMPWYPMMGNHDAHAPFLSAFPNLPRVDPARVYFSLDTSAGLFIALDTVRAGSHTGHLDDGQLAWLGETLTACEGHAFLFMHHPPMVTGIPSLDRIMLQDVDTFADMLAPHRDKVRHLFFGHMHRTFHGNWRGLSFSTVKSTAHQVYPNFEAPRELGASSEMPAYAAVFITEDTVAVHDISFLEEDKFFTYDREEGRKN